MFEKAGRGKLRNTKKKIGGLMRGRVTAPAPARFTCATAHHHTVYFSPEPKKISHPNDAGIFNQQYFTYIVITRILSKAAKVGHITLGLVG